jgi:cytochrome c551/c552
MNTATYREQARQAERALDWISAAALYAKAIMMYPHPARRDGLAERDVQMLAAKRNACLRMVQS